MGDWNLAIWLSVFALLIIAYLLGSIPSAVWIGKKYYGIDIREHGSKNAGTTNMLRVLGKRAALPVFVIDYFKGFGAVALTSVIRFVDVYDDFSEAWIINLRLLATLAVVLGHIFPIFAGFKGGKGVATLLGAGTGIFPPILLLCFGVWCFVFAMWHYVSLASMVAGCCYPFFVTIFMTMAHYDPSAPFESVPFILFAWSVAIMLVWTHRKNIKRLREGTESKIFLWQKNNSATPKDKDDLSDLIGEKENK